MGTRWCEDSQVRVLALCVPKKPEGASEGIQEQASKLSLQFMLCYAIQFSDWCNASAYSTAAFPSTTSRWASCSLTSSSSFSSKFLGFHVDFVS